MIDLLQNEINSRVFERLKTIKIKCCLYHQVKRDIFLKDVKTLQNWEQLQEAYVRLLFHTEGRALSGSLGTFFVNKETTPNQ